MIERRINGKHTPRDASYLNWVLTNPCCVTGSSLQAVAHHVRMNSHAGMGQKPSDYRTVPLTPIMHSQLHHCGERSFWESHGVDPEKVIAELVYQYMFYQSMFREISDALGLYLAGATSPSAPVE